MEFLAPLFHTALNFIGMIRAAMLDQGTTYNALTEWIGFAIQGGAVSCGEDCPGSQFTQIAAAWANIGYVTHSDLLTYITTTRFGLWAPLIYICAALGALVGVAINAPLRSYMWFMLGPAIYAFLIETTTQVQGVSWVVANQEQDMTDVWRNAEVGLANTDAAARRKVLTVDANGPQGRYEVAMPMVFLDELFSATTNLIIEWLGIYRHEGTGSESSNLGRPEGTPDGPWYLLSSLKWGMVENIVGVSARNPDFRDAFVTFLGSECGEEFKRGIDSGKYISAGSPNGAKKVGSVTVENEPNIFRDIAGRISGLFGGPGRSQYEAFQRNLDGVGIPTPRSVGRILLEGDQVGQFGQFAKSYSGNTPNGGKSEYVKNGHTQGIVCSTYLFTLVQQIRFEAGHWYWQLVRGSPNGLTREQFLRTLFYGWDIRPDASGPYASAQELNAFVKHLMMMYVLRNELLYAPQITEVNQRFAPAEQSRSFSEAYVRTMGSKAKYQELYNWAVLMPHMQGILVYFLVIAYPFAAMVMVLPGYYKTFFTWVSFFAWVKLWDVGFAVVMVLERSVWAMIGNNSNMARTGNMLISTAKDVGGIAVSCGQDRTGEKTLRALCAVPQVCSITDMDGDTCSPPGADQDQKKAWKLLDTLLTLGAGADLDLANGYYIYIMAALYFAVPAVTGQLVLGAKAGAASMLNSAIGGVSGEAGKAALTGYQHQAVNQALANKESLGQAAEQKGYRQAFTGADGKSRSFASGVLGAENAVLDEKLQGATKGLESSQAKTKAGLMNSSSAAYENAAGFGKKFVGDIPGVKTLLGLGSQTNKGGGSGGGQSDGYGQRVLDNAMNYAGYNLKRDALGESAKADQIALGLSGEQEGHRLRAEGQSAYGRNLEAAARQNAQMVAWEDKNKFASHASAMAGIAGMNTGALSPGAKPSDMRGMAMQGELDGYTPFFGYASKTTNAKGQAMYSGGGYLGQAQGMVKQNEDANKNLNGTFQNETWYGSFSTAAGNLASLGYDESEIRGSVDTMLNNFNNKIVNGED